MKKKNGNVCMRRIGGVYGGIMYVSICVDVVCVDRK